MKLSVWYLAPGPFVETEIALLLDRLRGGAIKDRFAFLRRALAGMMAGQIFFHFGVKPPRPDDSSANGHFNFSLCGFRVCRL